MLDHITMANAAAPAAPALVGTSPAYGAPYPATPSRVRPGAGPWPRCGESAVLLNRSARVEAAAAPSLMAAGRFLAARVQASDKPVLFGTGTQAAGQADFARQQRTSKQYHLTTKQYAHLTTRIAPNGGGALGPHPGRDPV
jgi:hypothetical protein